MMKIAVIRSGRRTMSLEVRSDGSVVVRAPYHMKDEEIRRFVEGKADWIRQHQRKMVQRMQEMREDGGLDDEQIRKLADQAVRELPPRIAEYAGKIGVTFGKITIRNQKTRWGSCSARGNLNFNCLLMLTPRDVQDYVIVHELCHRKEMNHSPRFWREVERVMPGYRGPRAWLKEHGGAIIGRMVEE